MPIEVSGVVRLHAVPKILRETIERRLTVFRPGSRSAATECLARREGPDLVVPRGAIGVVRAALADLRLRGAWVWQIVGQGPDRTTPGEVDPDLWPHQLRAASALLAGRQGVAELPTGAGKTRAASAALVASGRASVVLVPTADLADQWTVALRRLRVEPRRVGAGGRGGLTPLRLGEVAVCTVQALHRAGAQAHPLLGSAGCLVVDECHHVAARTWRAVVDACPAIYRWGLTATPGVDGEEEYVAAWLGPTLARVAVGELVRAGRLRSLRVLPVASGWTPQELHRLRTASCPNCGAETSAGLAAWFNPRGVRCVRRCGARLSGAESLSGRLDYGLAQGVAASEPDVLQLVVDLVLAAGNCGRTSLVLVPRRSATVELASRINYAGLSAVAVRSGMPGRAEAIEAVRSGQVRVLVATTLADEGLDIPTLDFAVSLMSGRKAGRVSQRSGRLLRLSGADPVLVEIVHGGEFRGQWKKRARQYLSDQGPDCLISERPVEAARAVEILLAELSSGGGQIQGSGLRGREIG